MPKKPAVQLYIGDWLKDPRLSMCSPATRGIWIDMLCAIIELDDMGTITGTVERLAQTCRSSADEMRLALAELKATKTADVTFRNDKVTVRNRRIHREEKERKQACLRQERHRKKKKKEESNEKVTLYSSSSSSFSLKEKDKSGDLSAKKTPPKNPKKNGSRIDPEFEPDAELIAWAKAECPAVSISVETQKFRNYWIAKAGAGGVKLDWRATWRNWMLNARDWAGGTSAKLPAKGSKIGKYEPIDSDSDTIVLPPPKPRRPPPNVAPEQKQIWQAVRDAVKRRYSVQVFDTWFRPVIFDGLDIDRNALKLRTDPTSVEWIRRFYAGDLIEIFTELGLAEFTADWEAEGDEISL